MKLQLDTTEKIIRIEESVNIGELMNVLDALLPNQRWKEFKLETNTQIVWSNPIIIEKYAPYPYTPTYPNPTIPFWELPHIICGATDVSPSDYTLKNGTFNIQLGK